MIRNLANGKVYIGQSQSVKRRVLNHKNYLAQGIHRNIHLQRAYDKYGVENFKYSVVEYCDISMLNEREIFWIEHYNSFHNGYNLTLGGSGSRGYTVSDKTKAKMAASRRDFSGELNPMYGKSWKDYTDEEMIKKHSENISRALLQLPREHVFCLNTGIEYTSVRDAAQKTGLTVGAIGNSCRKGASCNPVPPSTERLNFAYHRNYVLMSDTEIRQRISDSQHYLQNKNNPKAKKVVNLNTGEVFLSLLSGAEKYHIESSSISSCLAGIRCSAGKDESGIPIVWALYDDYIKMTRDEVEEKVSYAASRNKSGAKPNAMAVICTTTGDTFPTITDGAKHFHVDVSSVAKCCKGKCYYAGRYNGEKLHWEYVS